MTKAGVGSGGGSTGAWQSLELLKSVLGPASVVTVVLYYFGWARSNAIARFWGYSPELIGLSNEDYLLGSVSSLFRPLAVTILAVLAARVAFISMNEHVMAGRVPASVLRGLGWFYLAGFAGLLWAAGRLGRIEEETHQADRWYATGMTIIGGALLIWMGQWFAGAASWQRGRSRIASTIPAPPARFVPVGVTGLTISVGLLGLFVVTTQLAVRSGTARALEVRAELPDRAEVTVYSRERLHLTGSGIAEQHLSLPKYPLPSNQADGEAVLPVPTEGEFRWRYEGLRLLVQGSDQIVLAPADYRAETAEIFVLPVGDGLRLDLNRRTFWMSRQGRCPLEEASVDCVEIDAESLD